MIDVLHGTPEAAWLAWPELGSLPPARWDPRRPMIVVAPHPDDEVLALGGTLRLASSSGLPIAFLAVTDGEASHPGSAAITPAALAATRRSEAEAARAVLGLASAPVDHLGLRDGEVEAGHRILVDAILSRAGSDSVIVAPWAGDGHPDHEATGRAAAEAARRSGATLVEYPVWMWNWARPGDDRVPWHRARVTALTGDTMAAKGEAIGCFRSQILALGPGPADGPVLPSAELAHHNRPFEVVFA